MDLRRVAASGSIAVTGLGLVAGGLTTGVGPDGPRLALALTGLGVVLGFALAAAAVVSLALPAAGA